MARTTVLHVSDAHLGTGQCGSDGGCEEFELAFERAIEVAVERGVDAVVHTGDLVDDPRPALPTVSRCADVLDPPGLHDLPLYGIVDNRDRSNGERWLDLFRSVDAVTRLGREPTVVGDTAVYGIDGVRPDDWRETEFSLDEPPAGVDCAILCVHELLERPRAEPAADAPVEALLDRVDVDLDGLALGGSHPPASERVDGTDVWYPGATERFGTDDGVAGVVQLLEIDDGDVTRQRLELETGSLQSGDADGAVATLGDDRAPDEDSAGDRDAATLPTARNAVETAALRSFRGRSGREPVPAARNATEAVQSDRTTQTDQLEHDETLDDDMTDEREELIGERDRLAAELAELGDTIHDVMADLDAMDDDVAAAIAERDAATEAFLPDDRLPESVSDDTRDAVASYLDALGERADVRSEELAMKNAALDVQIGNAAKARDDIDETAAVVDRLGNRTEASASVVDDAREELDAARSRFADDLASLAAQLEAFDVDLSDGRLDAVIGDRIPELKSELQASIEDVRGRVEELSARTSDLAEDRDKLQSIDGGGTCPTCSQHVGPDRTEGELEEVEEELDEVERQLGAAKQERDDLIARHERLADLRVEAIALRSFRSETVAGAAGRLEDRREAFEDLQADLEEERAELAEVRAERDEADAAIATLESGIESLEAVIDGLQSDADEGATSIEAFGAVDELRAEIERRTDQLADLQEEYEEKEAERASLDAEIEDLSDA